MSDITDNATGDGKSYRAMRNRITWVFLFALVVGASVFLYSTRERERDNLRVRGTVRMHTIESMELDCQYRGLPATACHQQAMPYWEEWAQEFPELAKQRALGRSQ